MRSSTVLVGVLGCQDGRFVSSSDQPGVSPVQRFRSDLGLYVHLLVTDGAFEECTGELPFSAAPPPTPERMTAILGRVHEVLAAASLAVRGQRARAYGGECEATPSHPVCDEGTCVCTSDEQCADVPGYTSCIKGRCACTSDTDCSELGGSLDTCVDGVCGCSSADVCPSEGYFDGTMPVCEMP